MKVSIALLASGLAATQVAATWNRNAGYFNSPDYNNNECSDQQRQGFDWSGLQNGQSNFNYGDFNFGGGWTCKNSFGRRDNVLNKRFGGKAITNSCSKSKPATFSCDKRKDGFSVTDIDVSVEFDCDLEFHYTMPDNSICKQITPCKKEGTTVKNAMCGGAKSVNVYLGSHNESGRDSCEIGFHKIGFDCNPGKTYTPPPAYTPPASTPAPSQPASSAPTCGQYGQPPCESSNVESSTQPPESSTPAPSCGSYGAPPCEATSSSAVESSTPPPESSTPAPSCGGGYGVPPCDVPSSTSAESSSAETPTPSPPCGAPYGNGTGCGIPSSVPSSEVPSSTPPAGCGSYGAPPCETAPASETPSPSAPGSTPPSCGQYGQPPCESAIPSETPSPSQPGYTPPPVESTPPACGGYGAPPCETPSAPASETPAPSSSSPPSYTPPPGGYTPPEVLPKCLNTWLQIDTQCSDNTDSSCYCKIASFTDHVIQCVAAYGSQEEASSALQYFIGICANDIPQNPGIVTNCPSYIPLNPTTPAAPGAPTPSAPAPTGPAPSAPAPSAPAAAPLPSDVPCTTITYGSTSITVPQIVFTTQTPGAPGANPTEPIALVPGTTPPPAPAQTTGAPYPIPSGFSTTVFPTGTGGGGVSSGLPEFTGAASPLNVQVKGALLGAVLAFFAL
ncbi:hypothetical protein BU26DRAFT_91297 [Trematosphaeria pertusa]|uniref:CFEM domain-containing protein n=1 Tax=Trematosphaeria pertusa TaxID=390896 RepID=A0A6A6I156_9PLEO|nr:uncharacterized protein BU26DRAFT_91297 [Trematosphaeria pertusa]KAF2244007.1 hypothetical protein BU26DRAFT_91297 [Trematosphaeria pertusa]